MVEQMRKLLHVGRNGCVECASLFGGSPNAKPRLWVLVIVSTKSRSTGYYPAELAEKLFEKFGHDKYYDIAVEMERVRGKTGQNLSKC